MTGRPDRTPRRRRTAPLAERRVRSRPDRIALWAVVLGLFLALMAGATARSAEPISAPAPATTGELPGS